MMINQLLEPGTNYVTVLTPREAAPGQIYARFRYGTSAESPAPEGPAPDGGDWTGPKVARWIAEKTGSAHVWPQRGWDYLKRLGVDWRRRSRK